MANEEQLFEQELEILRNEAEGALQFFYAYLAIHKTAERQPEVYRLLNRTPLFWVTISGALQTSAFIALGRIFDEAKNSHSVKRLLHLAMSNPQLFKREALAVRKQRNTTEKPVWLDEYISAAYEPTPEDFEELRKKTDEI